MIDADRRDTLVRYTAGERTNHWIVAIAFVLAALSGLALFHPALFWLSNLFGGGPWTRILHPYLALVMLFAFLFLASTFWKDNRLQDRDWAWLRSEEHTSELQSLRHLVCRLLLEKKNQRL